MHKYGWALMQALDFVMARRPNLTLRASFLQQLSQWDQRRQVTASKGHDLVILNTLKNSKLRAQQDKEKPD